MNALATFDREYQRYNGISPRRIIDTRRVIVGAMEFAGIADPLLLDADILRGFLATQVAGGLAVTTVRKHRNMLMTFMRWAAETGRVDPATVEAMRRVPLPRGSRGEMNPNPYSVEEVAELWRGVGTYPFAGPQRLKRWANGTIQYRHFHGHVTRLQLEAVVAIALYGGLRMEEIGRLTVRQAHPLNDFLGVSSAAKNEGGYTRVRNVPWTTEHMHTAVTRWWEFRATLDCDHDLMWVHRFRKGEPMLRDSFRHFLDNVDGKRWSFRRLRHTAATELLRAGMPLEKVSRILGHTNVHQTLAYARIAGTDLQDASRGSRAKFSAALVPEWERAA
jgi:integrase